MLRPLVIITCLRSHINIQMIDVFSAFHVNCASCLGLPVVLGEHCFFSAEEIAVCSRAVPQASLWRCLGRKATSYCTYGLE